MLRMLVEVSSDSASVKRGADAVGDDEERARLRLRAEGQARPGTRHARRQAKTKARLEPRRGPET